MADIFKSIRLNLTRVADFSGRETRAEFWPYAIGLYLLSVAVGILLWIPVMLDMIDRMGRYFAKHPEGLPSDPAPYPGAQALPPELMPDVSFMILPMAVVNLLLVLLLAAAVVRRLHDRDKSAWWAALPIPFMIFGEIQGPEAANTMMTGAQPDPAMMLPIALNSLLYWVAFIALVVILAQEGSVGPNRYGPDSTRPY